jgi:acyl carrier protein
VVVAREDAPGDKRLVGYVIAASGASIDAAELRRYLSRSLPEYMVPAALVELESLPLTANGKLDRRRLLAPEWKGREYEAPVGETERMIAAVFGEVLRLERVGREDNFFELGGHSLIAMRVAARLRQRFAIEFPLRKLFEVPTVAGIAKEIDSHARHQSQKQSLEEVRALVADLSIEEIKALLVKEGNIDEKHS